jgi:hypothetical protein
MANPIKKSIRFVAIQFNGFFPCGSAIRTFFKNLNFIRAPFAFFVDCLKYKKLSKNKDAFKLRFSNLYPILYDRYEKAGDTPRHYFFQDLWAAKKVYKSGTKIHHDIGSWLDGFIAHCLPFCSIVMLDIRPLEKKIGNLTFLKTDCTNMKNIESATLESISSLHAIEHFGLGRYGDPVDPEGYKKAISEIQRVIKPGGNIYFSTPIGKEKLEFNAHRIFNPTHIKELFNQCEIAEFSAVDDQNEFMENANIDDFLDSDYSCGLFHFVKK